MSRYSINEQWGQKWDQLDFSQESLELSNDPLIIQKCRKLCLDNDECKGWTVTNFENDQICGLNLVSGNYRLTDTTPKGYSTISGTVVSQEQVKKVSKLYWWSWILSFLLLILIIWIIAFPKGKKK